MLGRRRFLTIAVMLFAAALGLSQAALAHSEHGHPVRIHDGTCEDLGGVAFRLNGVGGSVDTEGGVVATPAAVNPQSSYQVVHSETLIEASIDDLLTGKYAVMVYESDEAMDAIACGNVGGALMDGTLVTALAEAGAPGHSGFALFEADGDQTLVMMLIGHGLAPVSASGGDVGHGESDEDDRNHTDSEQSDGHSDEEPHDDGATPEA